MSDARFRVIVTTYNRADGLARLLDDLERENLLGPSVYVCDDASPRADVALDRRLAEAGCVLRRADRNHGRGPLVSVVEHRSHRPGDEQGRTGARPAGRRATVP